MTAADDRDFGRLEGEVKALKESLDEHKRKSEEFQRTLISSLDTIEDSLELQQRTALEKQGTWKTAAFFLTGASMGSAGILASWRKIIDFFAAG